MAHYSNMTMSQLRKHHNAILEHRKAVKADHDAVKAELSRRDALYRQIRQGSPDDIEQAMMGLAEMRAQATETEGAAQN